MGLLVLLAKSLVVLAAMTMLAGAAGVVLLTLVRRQVEVSTRHRAGIPITWLAHPGSCAVLTRRLRRAIASVRTVIPPPRRRDDPHRLADLADSLEQLAAATARQLVSTRHLRQRARQDALAAARRQVAQVEELAARLVSDASALDPDRPDPVTWETRRRHLDDELRLRDEARRDVGIAEDGVIGFDPSVLDEVAREAHGRPSSGT